jgi:hypothetical protein
MVAVHSVASVTLYEALQLLHAPAVALGVDWVGGLVP